MEKADILEMTVQYMRELKREECKPQGKQNVLHLVFLIWKAMTSRNFHFKLPRLLPD